MSPQRRIRIPRHIGGPKLRGENATGVFAGRRAQRATGQVEPSLRQWAARSLAWTDGFKRGAWTAARFARRGLRRR